MIRARLLSGELPIFAEPGEESHRMASLRTDEGDLLVRSTRADRWTQVERPGGRLGWIQGDDPRLELLRSVRVTQSKVSVLARPGDRGEPLRVLKRHARLSLLRTEDEAGERWVRVRLPSGKEGYVAGGTRVVDEEFASDGAGEPHGFVIEEWLLRRGVVGGVALIAIAAAWFFIGLELGWIFYYPPALAVLGAVGIVLGLRAGHVGALETAARLAPPAR